MKPTPPNPTAASRRGFLLNSAKTLPTTALERATNLGTLQPLDDPARVQPDTTGRYPVPVPGQTQVL